MPRISIIEDDQLISQMYRMKLEAEGYDVDIAENDMDIISQKCIQKQLEYKRNSVM